MEARFTIKNYRCFSADHPLQFTLKDGFTAFVGPNNFGKSFILKFFYEFRNVWNDLRQEQNLKARLVRAVTPIDFVGIKDKQEVFYRFNELPIEVQIEINEFKFCFNINRGNQIDNAKMFLDDEAIKGVLILISNGILTYHTSGSPKAHNIRPLVNLIENLWRSIYIPSFRNAINVGANETYFDINVGSAFIKIWYEWKAGPSIWQNRRVHSITNHIKELFEYEKLEINTTPDLTSLQIIVNDETYKLHE